MRMVWIVDYRVYRRRLLASMGFSRAELEADARSARRLHAGGVKIGCLRGRVGARAVRRPSPRNNMDRLCMWFQ